MTSFFISSAAFVEFISGINFESLSKTAVSLIIYNLLAFRFFAIKEAISSALTLKA